MVDGIINLSNPYFDYSSSFQYSKRFLKEAEDYNKIEREVQRFPIYFMLPHMHSLSITKPITKMGTFSLRLSQHQHIILNQSPHFRRYTFFGFG